MRSLMTLVAVEEESKRASSQRGRHDRTVPDAIRTVDVRPALAGRLRARLPAMMKATRTLLMGLSLAAIAPFTRAEDVSPIAITHVTVIDAAGGPAQSDATVVLRGGRVSDVSPSASAKSLAGARVVDGTGKFLIPGLWDMHIHSFFGDWVPGGREVTLPLLLA